MIADVLVEPYRDLHLACRFRSRFGNASTRVFTEVNRDSPSIGRKSVLAGQYVLQEAGQRQGWSPEPCSPKQRPYSQVIRSPCLCVTRPSREEFSRGYNKMANLSWIILVPGSAQTRRPIFSEYFLLRISVPFAVSFKSLKL